MHRTHLFQWLCLSVFAVTLSATRTSSAAIEVDAVTKARDDIEIKFTVGGIVKTVHVKRGDRVEKGQTLIELEDEENKALIAATKLQAESDLAIQAREAELKLATLEAERLKKLVEKKSSSEFELERAIVERTLAELNLENAKLQKRLAGLELERYEATHARYTRKAPWAGLIDDITISEGDTVEPLAPIGRLVVLDPLVIDAPVQTVQVSKLKLGDPAWVRLVGSGPNEGIQGKIEFIAQVADAASDTTLVGIEVTNPRTLKPGRHVTVSFAPPSGMASASKQGQ